jgi:hypothetical protein
MPHALVLVGHGRYEDPWHDHAATSHALATLLTEDGWDVTLRSTFPDALDGVARPDLLVVNAGSGRPDPAFDGDDDAWLPFHDRRAALVADGVPVLAVHQSANTFVDDPRWAATLGGRWVEGTSWHPPLGDAVFRVADDAHPVTAALGAAPLAAYDERYLDLVRDPSVHVLAVARHDDVDHPVVWVAPDGLAVYSALGHDVRSYSSASHRVLLRSAVAWLTR